MASKIETVEQAKAAGAVDGREDVEIVLREQGAAVVIATLRRGHVAWSEDAAGAGSHRMAGIKDEDADNYEELRTAYYEAYDAAAVARAREIASEEAA